MLTVSLDCLVYPMLASGLSCVPYVDSISGLPCVPYVGSISGLSNFDWHSVFSNIHLWSEFYNQTMLQPLFQTITVYIIVYHLSYFQTRFHITCIDIDDGWDTWNMVVFVLLFVFVFLSRGLSLLVLLSFFFGHCVVCSLIYEFWLPLWYLQTLLRSTWIVFVCTILFRLLLYI
jgi:hypothetical protein